MPPALLCLLDGGLTLYGQTESYWAGDYASVNELSPSFAGYLATHPLVAVGALLLWVGIFSVVIALLPEFLALTVSMAIVLGHLGGAQTWLLYRFDNYQASNALCFITAFLAVLSFKKGQTDDGSSVFDWRRTGLPPWSRWAAVLTLIGLPVWWFLIPR